jgi:hypothetical protein
MNKLMTIFIASTFVISAASTFVVAEAASGEEVVIQFKEEMRPWDSFDKGEMWLTSEVTAKVFTLNSAESMPFPCTFEFRVTKKGKIVNNPALKSEDASIAETTVGSNGVVALRILKEGRSAVTVTVDSFSRTLDVQTVKNGNRLECQIFVK